MENMPPDEMWIVEQGTRTRYYRTAEQYRKWVSKNHSRINAIWYYDFGDPYAEWIQIEKENWPL